MTLSINQLLPWYDVFWLGVVLQINVFKWTGNELLWHGERVCSSVKMIFTPQECVRTTLSGTFAVRHYVCVYWSHSTNITQRRKSLVCKRCIRRWYNYLTSSVVCVCKWDALLRSLRRFWTDQTKPTIISHTALRWIMDQSGKRQKSNLSVM